MKSSFSNLKDEKGDIKWNLQDLINQYELDGKLPEILGEEIPFLIKTNGNDQNTSIKGLEDESEVLPLKRLLPKKTVSLTPSFSPSFSVKWINKPENRKFLVRITLSKKGNDLQLRLLQRGDKNDKNGIKSDKSGKLERRLDNVGDKKGLKDKVEERPGSKLSRASSRESVFHQAGLDDKNVREKNGLNNTNGVKKTGEEFTSNLRLVTLKVKNGDEIKKLKSDSDHSQLEIDRRQFDLEKKEFERQKKGFELKKIEFDRKLIEFNKKMSDVEENKTNIDSISLEEREQAVFAKEKLLASKIKEYETQKRQLNGVDTPTVSSITIDQKKREQLKQLNNDVIMKENLPNLPQVSAVSNIDKLSSSEREEMKNSLLKNKSFWQSQVKDARAMYDKEQNELELIIISIDIIIMTMVVNDFDERSKDISGILPSERSWKTLDQEIQTILHKMKSYLLGSKSRNLFPFLQTIRCFLYQTSAIVIKRINAILTKVILLYSSKDKDTDLKSKIIDLQQACITNHERINSNFNSSNQVYISEMGPSKYPKTYSKKWESLRKLNEFIEKNKTILKPHENPYYLPLGTYSDLNQVMGLLYNLTQEFINNFNNHHKDSLLYNLKSGKR